MAVSEEEKRRREAKVKARIDAYIKGLVDQAPPLTNEQRARIAALLHPRS